MHPRRLKATERSQLAFNLRLKGYDFDAIAKACGYSGRSGAWKAVRKHLDRIGDDIREKAEELRTLDGARLDRLLRSLLPLALGAPEFGKAGDADYQREVLPDLTAVDRVLKIMERRAKMFGLDAAEKFIVTSRGKPDDATSDHRELAANTSEEELSKLYAEAIGVTSEVQKGPKGKAHR